METERYFVMTLVILAAGMGSRYGGLKQIDPLGPGGEFIIDYSIYDAIHAGFDRVVFIIKKENLAAFEETVGTRVRSAVRVEYVFQDINDIPEGFQIPEERVKPWGTGHAVRSIRGMIDAPFAVINADDYYGPEAFKVIYDYLSNAEDGEYYDYCMVGYRVENTISENGGVTRGVCVGKDGYLQKIHETPEISRREDGVIRATENGQDYEIPEGTLVSMNCFGFTPGYVDELDKRFPAALEEILKTNPKKGEFYVPLVVGDLVEEGKAKVRILDSADKWFGVTYKEDRPGVVAAMKEKTKDGLYPAALWK